MRAAASWAAGSVAAPLEQLRRSQDGAQGVAQIVRKQRAEHFVQAQRLGPLLELLSELLALAVELEEHIGLVLENVRLDGLVDEVDGSRFVAFEHALRLAGAGGDENDRYMARTLAAAHELGELEAVHVGHLHIEKGEREVMDEQELESLRPGLGAKGIDVLALQERGQREQVVLEVIDQQALDPRQRDSVQISDPPARPARAQSLQQLRDALQVQHEVHGLPLER